MSLLYTRSHAGTAHFMGAIALRHGFELIKRLGGMKCIREHTKRISTSCVRMMRSLRHDNGNAVVNVYGWNHENVHGPVVAFNVKDRDGTFVGYASVERVLSSHKIQVRTGCFCNPGACMKWLEQSEKDVVNMYTNLGDITSGSRSPGCHSSTCGLK